MPLDFFNFCFGEFRGNYESWIPILRFSHGLSHLYSDSESPSGQLQTQRCNHGSFNISKKIDKFSPGIFHSCVVCQKIDLARVHFVDDVGGQEKPVLTYEFKNATINGYEIDGSADFGEYPVETFSIDYAFIEMKYFDWDNETKINEYHANWDKGNNKGESALNY